MRVVRKVKIEGRWVIAPVPMDSKGRPDAKHVLHKGALVDVDGGTFYIATGRGAARKHVACGTDPETVRRAMRTQAHVLELRREGMAVDDAPEIVASRRTAGITLRDMAKAFQAEPPTGFSEKTIKKYENAFRTFATWAATVGVYSCDQVTKQTIARWIAHLQKVETLDGSTIVPKVNIVLAELKQHGTTVVLDERTLPKITQRERDIYTDRELEAIFRACDLEEYELFQVFLLTGMRYREVAFLAWSDVDPVRRTIRVSRKRELGFVPKAYHERTIPVPQVLIDMLQRRADRMVADGAGLMFPTSTQFFKRGGRGGKADRKMLEKLKQIARRAGLNCGHCRGTYKGKDVTCETHAICRRWGLHKFRHTYATSMLRDKVDIVTVSRWLGHKDLATTRIYLRALDAEMAQPQVEQSTLARVFAGKPPAATRARKASRLQLVGQHQQFTNRESNACHRS